LLLAYLGATWKMRRYGGGGTNSTKAREATSQPLSTYANRRWGWRMERANLVTIELGINNNLTGATHYADLATGMAAWTTDVTEIVERLIARGTPADHILVLGHPPWTAASGGWAGLYIGGAAEDTFQLWNGIDDHVVDGIMPAITSTGAVFVPLHDVYGDDYDVDTDAGDFTTGAGPGNTNTHPNAAGYSAIYNRILEYLPSPILTGRIG